MLADAQIQIQKVDFVRLLKLSDLQDIWSYLILFYISSSGD